MTMCFHSTYSPSFSFHDLSLAVQRSLLESFLHVEDPLGDQPEEEPDLTVRAATADTEGTTVSVRGKPWEVIRIEGDRVFLKLVNGTMKKQFPLAKVQEALRSGGYI